MILYYLRDINYFQGFNQIIDKAPKLVSELINSNLSSNEDQMSHDLQPGDYVY